MPLGKIKDAANSSVLMGGKKMKSRRSTKADKRNVKIVCTPTYASSKSSITLEALASFLNKFCHKQAK